MTELQVVKTKSKAHSAQARELFANVTEISNRQARIILSAQLRKPNLSAMKAASIMASIGFFKEYRHVKYLQKTSSGNQSRYYYGVFWVR